jgi:hypothetical protein
LNVLGADDELSRQGSASTLLLASCCGKYGISATGDGGSGDSDDDNWPRRGVGGQKASVANSGKCGLKP